MLIGVISDSHFRAGQKAGLGIELLEKHSLNAIIHCGDWEEMEFSEYLPNVPQVFGVYGNCDDFDIIDKFPRQQVVELEGVKIGVIHGDGGYGTTEERAIFAFSDSEVDCICYGHSHIPVNHKVGDVLVINPGSLSRPRGKIKKPSMALLEIAAGKILKAEIIYID